MTFQQLSYLLEISRCGSINKAAQKLYLSQSAVSSAVKALEEELGIRFFERSNHGVSFTPEGREFLNYAVSLLDSKRQLEQLYRKRGRESVGCYLSISTQRYPFVEAAFQKVILAHGESAYRFELRETGMDGVIDDVSGRRSDLGVIFLSDLSEKLILRLLASRELLFHELIRLPPRVYVRRGHPLTRRAHITEGDLVGYPYVTFEQSQGVAVDFSEEYQLFPAQPPAQKIVINTRSAAVNIVACTDAVTTGTGLLLPKLNSPDVVSLPIEGAPEIRLGWLQSKGSRLSPLAAEFLDALKASIRESVAYTEGLTQEARQA